MSRRSLPARSVRSARSVRVALATLAAAALLATAGCASRRCCPCPCPSTSTASTALASATAAPASPAASVAGPIPFHTSGFLADYARLKPGAHPGTWVWMKDGLDLRAYDNVRFDPIELRFVPGSVGASATEEQRAKATNGFTKILKDRLSPYFPVLDAPAPDTLTVRIALTDVQPTGSGVDGQSAQVGGATLEGEIKDAVTGDLLVTFVSRIEGSTRGETAPEEWRSVEGAFREWADRLLDFLELHAR